MYSERIVNAHGFCILPTGPARLCSVLLVVNVVTVFTFVYLLTLTHNVYILLGGLITLCKHRGRHGISPASPMETTQKKLIISFPLAWSSTG